MGMTLDKYLKETNTVLITQDAFVEMKNTMRKYQKIEKIIEEWSVDNGAFAMSESYWLNTIRKAVEDGNDD